MAAFPKLPLWLEKLVINSLKSYADPVMLKAAFEALLVPFIANLKALSAATPTLIDDMIVAKVADVLTTCSPDVAFLCEMIEKGEAAVIAFLRVQCTKTDTRIDDTLVDIVEAAIKA